MAKKVTPPAPANRKEAANVTPEVNAKAVKAFSAAAVKHASAGSTLLNTVSTIVLTFGLDGMTSEQWDKAVKAALVAALAACPTLSAKSQEKYLYNFKTGALGLMLAKHDARFALRAGETLSDYNDRIKAILPLAKLPNGLTVYPVKADGTAAKKGPKAKTTAQKAAAKKTRETDAAIKTLSAASLRDTEGGYDAKRSTAVATSLMGSEAAGGVLIRILSEHRAEFDKWASTTLRAADEADAKAKAKSKTDEADAKAMASAIKANGSTLVAPKAKPAPAAVN